MKHALVRAVGNAQHAKNESDVNDLSALLFEQAQILDGEVPDDPAAFAARLNRLVVRGDWVRRRKLASQEVAAPD
jgi:molecular chaperone HtpG